MSTLKPFETIASRFNISHESAKYFLGRIQKSFKKEKPPQPLIVEFMTGLEFEHLPKPYLIARMMHDSGVWAHAMNAEPRDPQDEPELDFVE